MKKLPNQTLANAFVMLRVPPESPIYKDLLLSNLKEDIRAAHNSRGFKFTEHSRRATPERTISFLLERGLLSSTISNGRELITRNDRTKRYLNRLPKAVMERLDELPTCDPLTLLAGTKK